MTHIRAIFARSHNIGSILIRVFGAWGGKWSHVGILDDSTNTVIEAMYPKGVVETPVAVFLSRYSKYEIVETECPDPAAALKFARSCVGRKYDWLAIIGMIIKEPIAKLQEWFCNELYEDALIQGGRIRFRIPTRSVTVEQSYRTI